MPGLFQSRSTGQTFNPNTKLFSKGCRIMNPSQMLEWIFKSFYRFSYHFSHYEDGNHGQIELHMAVQRQSERSYVNQVNEL